MVGTSILGSWNGHWLMVGLWMMMVARCCEASWVNHWSKSWAKIDSASARIRFSSNFFSIPKYPKDPKAILDSSPQLYFGDRRKTPRVCRTPRPPAIPRLQSSRLGVVEKLTMFGIWTSLKLELVFLMLPMLGLLEHPFRPTFRKDVQGYNDVILLYEHFRGCSLRLRLGPRCQERVYMRGREQEAAGRKRALWALCWAIWNWDPHILWWNPIPLILNTHQHSHLMIPNMYKYVISSP